MPCWLCESEENLTKCPICQRQVCRDDTLLGKNGPLCMSCRVDEINQNGSGLLGQDPFVEGHLQPDEDDGSVASGLLYKPTPLANTKLRDFSASLKSLNLLDLKQVEQLCQEKSSLAKHIHIFRQHLSYLVEDELHRRLGSARKRRQVKRQALAAAKAPLSKTRKAPQSKIIKLAAQLSKMGISAAQLSKALEAMKK